MLNNNITRNILWRLLERFGVQIVTFIVSVILARILDPGTYGLVALVTAFITILGVFIDGGFVSSLIQKKDADDLDFSSVFYFSVVMCSLLYLLLFICAPYIAKYYNNEEITNITRVLGICLLIAGFKNIQSAYVSRNLMFKKYFLATLSGTILSAIISIWMALKGYGVWSLVWLNVINNFINAIVLWCTVGWKPKLAFSFARLKKLFNFGIKILASALIDTIWRELRELIIGKQYSTEDLAYYNKGSHYPESAISSIMTAFDSVLLPVMANSQDNVVNVKRLVKKSIKMCSFILWPLLMGIAACSNNIISVLLTDKWLPSVPYLIIFCIVYAFQPIHTANLNVIKALGRSDIVLKLEIIKKICGLIIIVIAMRYGVFALAVSALVSNVLNQIINSWPNRKLINYTYFEQLKDIMPSFLLSLLMGVVVYCINYIGCNSFITLCIQIPLGVVIYVGISYLFKNENLYFCVDSFKKILRKE